MPTLDEIKRRQQIAWSSGDYSKIAWITVPLADILCEAVDVESGTKVLDVATGTGHVALAAARRFCDVTGVDYVPQLLDHGRRRAEAEGLNIEFIEGDAEDLPFADESFDYVLSAIGAMFAPDQQKVANELTRVCRSGGTIGMINWMPDGFIGELFKLIGRHVPPPAGLKPASLWGTQDHVIDLFGDAVSNLEFKEGACPQHFPSAEFYAKFFLQYYGPTLKAWESLNPKSRESFERDLIELATSFNRATRSLTYESSYLLVKATKNLTSSDKDQRKTRGA
jgi:ubiquinone/menaquinone biosynthesis C-methylase UbiE